LVATVVSLTPEKPAAVFRVQVAVVPDMKGGRGFEVIEHPRIELGARR
jgi:hypothetical protein